MKPKYLHAAIVVLSLLVVGTQPALGTRYIPSDTSIGTWDEVNRIYTLTTDVSETIQIDEDNLTLDGAGYTVTATSLLNGVSLRRRTGVTVKNINVQGSPRGIYLFESSGNALIGNTTSNSYYGITLREHSDNNTLIGNTATDGDIGIMLNYNSSGNTLTGNTLTGNEQHGICIGQGCSNNTLTGNTATTNRIVGIFLSGNANGTLTGNFTSDNSCGIYVRGTINQILTGNTAHNNLDYGIRLLNSNYNTLTRNTVSNNGYGVTLSSSSNNHIYNNNFIGNSTQASVGGSDNVFNLPAPKGGNYWSDWTSPDDDSDGFVDTPYEFSYGRDNLPWKVMDGWPNEPPVADAGPDQTAIVGENVQFNGGGSYDTDGTIASYSWDFGDEATAAGAIVAHAYTVVDTYTVTLTVTDDNGATGTDEATVTVITPAQAIVGLIGIVEDMNLQQGIANSFDAKLEAVHDALVAANAGVREDAVNKLVAFANAVEAQRGKQLTDAQADELVIYAGWIIAALSG